MANQPQIDDEIELDFGDRKPTKKEVDAVIKQLEKQLETDQAFNEIELTPQTGDQAETQPDSQQDTGSSNPNSPNSPNSEDQQKQDSNQSQQPNQPPNQSEEQPAGSSGPASPASQAASPNSETRDSAQSSKSGAGSPVGQGLSPQLPMGGGETPPKGDDSTHAGTELPAADKAEQAKDSTAAAVADEAESESKEAAEDLAGSAAGGRLTNIVGALIGKKLDEKTKAGRILGLILFAIWGLVFFLTGVTPIIGIINGIFGGIIFNLLLVSPKLVYQITEKILFAVGIGEILKVGDKFGLDKTNIRVGIPEKATIIALDIGFILWHGLLVVSLIYMSCQIGATTGKVLRLLPFGEKVFGTIADLRSGLPVSQIQSLCSALGSPSGAPVDTSVSGNPSAGTCLIVNNPSSGCYVDKLAGACRWDAKQASQICNKESAGGLNPAIGGTADYCYPYGPDGEKFPMSIGYFQINIFNSYSPEFTSECAGVLRDTGCWVERVPLKGTNIMYCPKRKCSFGPAGQAGYNKCVAALSNGDRNTKQACNLYRQANNSFRPWSAASVCNISN